MELKTRNITEKDWSMLCSWWEGHKWPIPNNDALPNNGTGGIIVEENNIPVIAGFIFKTNSKGCWLEFIISDPNYKNDRSHIIDKLIDENENMPSIFDVILMPDIYLPVIGIIGIFGCAFYFRKSFFKN